MNEILTGRLPYMSLGYILRLPDGERHIRLENRKRRRQEHEKNETGVGCHDDEVIVEVVVEMGVGCQASIEMSDKDSQTSCSDVQDIDKLQQEVILLREDNQIMTEKILTQPSPVLSIAFLENETGVGCHDDEVIVEVVVEMGVGCQTEVLYKYDAISVSMD